MLEYCDYLAHVVHTALTDDIVSADSLVLKVHTPKLDLHTTEGWLQSSSKTILVEDRYGTIYKVTIEALDK